MQTENRYRRLASTTGSLLRTMFQPLAMILIALIAAPLGVPLLAGTAFTDSDVVRQLAAWGILDYAGGGKKRVIAKTADYTIVSPVTAAGDASGTIFTNRGAGGAVIFTLPAPVQALAGVYYEFLGIANQNITVATATADTLIVVNDLTADSLAISTTNQKIGSLMRVVCDGTSWIAYGTAIGAGGDTGTNTYTVAT